MRKMCFSDQICGGCARDAIRSSNEPRPSDARAALSLDASNCRIRVPCSVRTRPAVGCMCRVRSRLVRPSDPCAVLGPDSSGRRMHVPCSVRTRPTVGWDADEVRGGAGGGEGSGRQDRSGSRSGAREPQVSLRAPLCIPPRALDGALLPPLGGVAAPRALD
eukprot:9204118-Pyramimonas_sp.AAC.2